MNSLKDYLPENVGTYSDYKELLARDDLDWIMIGSKNNEHHEHCIAAFKSNRHVFCEKPLAISVQECEDIRAAQLKFSKLFVTGFVLRHAPLYRKIHEIVTEQKLLGKIVSVEANEILMPGHGGYIFRNWRRFREQAGPHILEKYVAKSCVLRISFFTTVLCCRCCHDIDILNWILDSVPSRVTALGGLDIFTPENKPEDEAVEKLYKTWTWAYEDVDPFTAEKTIEDNLMGIMQYRNGAKVSFHTNCNASFGQRRLLICGVKGSLEADLVSGKIRYQVIGQDKVTGEMKAAGAHGGGDYNIIEDLVRSMCAGAKPHASGEEGFRSALVCLALDKSRREDGAWVNLEEDWKKFDV
jgi:predicted dehydrogenase